MNEMERYYLDVEASEEVDRLAKEQAVKLLELQRRVRIPCGDIVVDFDCALKAHLWALRKAEREAILAG